MNNVISTDENVKASSAVLPIDFAEARKHLTLLGIPEEEGTWLETHAERRVVGPDGELTKKLETDDGSLTKIFRHGRPEELASILTERNRAGAGVYVAVNPIEGDTRDKENVKRIRAVFADFDNGLPDKLPLPPTFWVVSSPGKKHAYWVVDGLTLEKFDGVEAVLVAQFGADKKAKDRPRILRLAGTSNVKDPRAPHRVVVEEGSGRTYTAEEILAAFPPSKVPRKATARKPENEKIVQGLLTAQPSGIVDPSNPRVLDSEEVEKIRALAAFLDEKTDEAEFYDYDTWLEWGMALHEASGGVAQARELWDEFSEQYGGDKYNEKVLRSKWDSFTPREDGEALTLGTIYGRAKDLGWSWPPLKSIESEPERLAAYRATLDALAQKDAATASFEYSSVAKEFGVPRGEIAKLVQERRKKKEGADDRKLLFPIDEPWPVAVDGEALLDELAATIKRHAILPEYAPEAIALWLLHAHTHDAATHSPILCLSSPEKRCGKTTVAKLVKGLAPRGFHAANTTEAALFRMVDSDKPTLIIDEADTFLRDNPGLRGILNAGHDRESAVVPRANSETGKVETFSTWAPKVIALIHKLPDTLEDRSIVITLERKKTHQKVDRLPSPILSGFRDLRRQAARWAEDNIDRLRGANPAIPDRLDDRAADNWGPLFAIAGLISSEWGKKAREAALGLQRGDDAEDSIGVQLLRDIRQFFMTTGLDRISPTNLLSNLINIEVFPESPWRTLRGGREIDLYWLGNRLRSYKVFSKKIGGARWYLNTEFEKAWAAYLEPFKAEEDEKPSGGGFIGRLKTDQPRRRNTASQPDSPLDIREESQGGRQLGSSKIGIFNRDPNTAEAPTNPNWRASTPRGQVESLDPKTKKDSE